jgi:hypothetical protein
MKVKGKERKETESKEKHETTKGENKNLRNKQTHTK